MCNALTVTKRESAPLPERLCERIAYCAILLTVYEADYSVVVAQSEGADHRYYSTPEMQNILLQNVVGHAVRKAKNFAGGATDAILSGRKVMINLMSNFVLDKTKATAEGHQWESYTLEHIANNARFAAGGQCDQCVGLLVGYSCSLTLPCRDVFQVCDPIFVRLYSLRNFSRINAQGANLSDSYSYVIFLRCLFRAGDGVLVDSLLVILCTCKAMRRSSSHHGDDSYYSDSLALRRWSSSRATVTSCPISSTALTPIFSTCASALSEETRGFSPLPSAWRRAISPRMAVTMNPALLSPSSFTDSMPSKASCGIRIEICFDLSLIVFFAMCILLNKRCDSVYTKKNHKKYLTCDSVKFNLNHTSVRGYKRQRPELFAAVAGRLTKPLNEVTIMAGAQHTQTHPKFIYTFLAVHRDCMADGKNTVHVAADTLVDACEMLNDMGYISATWKGREENTLFIQKCENNFIWRFIALSTAQPRVIHIEATSEQEARQQSPDGCVMVFAARIRQEVEHV
ncbi:host cell division inhibitor Icd-like protein [Escherichia coli]|nr:host cell division inhibitor Icd-like protein [Escherichia coli]MDI0600612.1 host cell division inhibitor Icd-like protein [Escherichia coli]